MADNTSDRKQIGKWINVDGKHSMDLRNVNVYVCTGPNF